MHPECTVVQRRAMLARVPAKHSSSVSTQLFLYLYLHMLAEHKQANHMASMAYSKVASRHIHIQENACLTAFACHKLSITFSDANITENSKAH